MGVSFLRIKPKTYPVYARSLRYAITQVLKPYYMSSIDQSSFYTSIPSELICPICSDILHNPVITPCQHLFCEHDLLQWFIRAPDEGDRSQRCPQCNTVCKPDTIKKAGRIITNIIGDLERRCEQSNCTWIGPSRNYERHLKTCACSNTNTNTNTSELGYESKTSDNNTTTNNNHEISQDNPNPESSSRKLRALYLRRKLEEATAEQKEASRHGSKEVSLLHRQLAELVQHNKGLSERNRELDRQNQQYKERCNLLERALLGPDAVDSFDKAREDSLREARKYME